MSDEREEQIEELLAAVESPLDRAGLLLAREHYDWAIGAAELALGDEDLETEQRVAAFRTKAVALYELGRHDEARASAIDATALTEAIDDWPVDVAAIDAAARELADDEHYEEALERVGEGVAPFNELWPSGAALNHIVSLLMTGGSVVAALGDRVAGRHFFDLVILHFDHLEGDWVRAAVQMARDNRERASS